LKREPRSDVLLVGVGNTYRHQGRLTDAIASYQAAINAQPTSPTGYLALGDGKLAIGDFVGARENYQKARGYLRNNLTEDLSATEKPAALESRLGNSNDALALARQSVVDVPYRAEPSLLLGTLLIAQERYDEADAAFQAALAVDPQSVAAVTGMAQIRQIQMLRATSPADVARYQAAARDKYATAIKMRPTDPTVWHAWATFLHSQKDWAAADAAAKQAITLAPNRAAGYVLRDLIAESQGQDG